MLKTMINTDNIFQTSLLITVGFPAAIILIGAVVSGVQQILMKVISAIFSSAFTFVLVNYLMFPGVMLHEISHAVAAVVTGAKLTEVALFKPSGGSLGHVSYRARGPKVLQSIQRVMVSAAPVYLGGVYVYLFYYMATAVVSSLAIKVILGYLAFSMIFHMTMSFTDFKGFFKGLPWFMVGVFVISLVALVII